MNDLTTAFAIGETAEEFLGMMQELEQLHETVKSLPNMEATLAKWQKHGDAARAVLAVVRYFLDHHGSEIKAACKAALNTADVIAWQTDHWVKLPY